MSRAKSPKLVDPRAHQTPQAKRHQAVLLNRVVPEKPSVGAAVVIHGNQRPAGEAVTPVDVVPVKGIASGYDQRVQVGPDWVPPEGGFSAAGIGRYLD